jgi:hypothetical protein
MLSPTISPFPKLAAPSNIFFEMSEAIIVSSNVSLTMAIIESRTL